MSICLQIGNLVLLVLANLLVPASNAGAADKSGVSPDRIRLPKGPGSLEGTGENVEPNLNMGLMTYRVPVALPEGYPGLTPDLSFHYNSGAGNSELGLGWSLPLPTIERMTARGLPRYTPDDVFAANGSEELVRVSGEVFRARFEKGFVRYTFRDPSGDGRGGHWQAEYPDGRIGHFGATSDGELVPEARVDGADGVFRYNLVEMSDVFGHRVRYLYEKDGAVSRLERVEYVFRGSTPDYSAVLSYEPRSDHLSDAKSGVELRFTERLTGIKVTAHGTQLRRYVLSYEPEEVSGGQSRLSRVSWFGTDETVGEFPISFGFAYSAALGESAPALVAVGGSLGLDLAAGTADLVDMNADGLPDVIDTSGPKHLVFLNERPSNSGQRFADAFESSAGTIALASPNTEMFDLDGDGRTDMVDPELGYVLWNRGSGDWFEEERADTLDMPRLAEDANLRFLDWDGDKQIDVFKADVDAPQVFANRGNGSFELITAGLDPLGASFTTDNLELSDMNGDGLLDCVRKASGVIEYRMNLGYGRWSPDSTDAPGGWIPIANVPSDFSGAAIDGAERLVDLNGDGQSDLVVVVADDVRYAINQSGRSLGPFISLRQTTNVEVPERSPGVSFRFADMNGSGSTDIVYVTSSGGVSYIELFPQRPNLLTRVTNGIGKEVDISYGSSVDHMRTDGGSEAWTHRLPQAMLTVDEIVVRDGRSPVEQRQTIHYSNGFYDGEERQFRGFGNVVVETRGDDSAETGTVRHHFDVGDEDVYRKGLLLDRETESAGDILSTTTNLYAESPLAEVAENLEPHAVRFLYLSDTTEVLRERRPSSEWKTIRTTYDYGDGYGNLTLTSRLGIIPTDERSCACTRPSAAFGAPCGKDCTGDESFESVTFVVPPNTSGRWILNRPAQRRVFGEKGSDVFSEENTYYDDSDELGVLEVGLPTRVEVKVAESDYLNRQRLTYNGDGAVLQATDGNEHRRTFTYDATSLRVEAETIHFDDRSDPYALTMTASYHPVFDTVESSSSWMLGELDALMSPARATSYRWDAFARLVAVARPGDDIETSPTEEYDYSGIGAPVSSIVRRSRSQTGGRLDLEEVQCFDGLGRKLQTRTRIDSTRLQISGFTEFNAHGAVWRSYQPFVDSSPACDLELPDADQRLFTETTYDSTGRTLSVFEPDDGIQYPGRSRRRSETRAEYRPLETIAHDAEDTDDESPHFGTSMTTIADGLGRTIRHERRINDRDADGNPLDLDDEGIPIPRSVPIDLTYNALGRLRGYVQEHDGKTIEKVQIYDLAGRMIEVHDPDSGVTSFEYDRVDNVVRETTPHFVVRSLYDEANRLVRQWDENDTASTISYDYDFPTDCERCTNVEGQLARVRYPTNYVPPDSGIEPVDGIEHGKDAVGYDERSQPIYSRRTHDGHVFELGTSFDNAGRVVGRHYPTGHDIAFELDAMGRLRAVPDFIDEVTYEGRGLLQSVAYANGVGTGYRYDAVGRLSSIEAEGPNSTIQSYAYSERDRVGNILRVEDASEFGDGASANARHRYDDWYRLTWSQLDEERSAYDETLAVAYNDLDNIVSKTSTKPGSPDHVGAYEHSGENAGPHAVTTAGDSILEYDSAGNMTRHEDDHYQWDFLGRLWRAYRGDEELGRYTYGPDRTRIRKSENGHLSYYVAPDFEVRDGTAFIYVSLGDRKVVKIEVPEYATSFLADLAPGSAEGNEFTPDPDGVITAGDAWIAQALVTEHYVASDVDVEVDDALVDELLAASVRRMLGSEVETATYLHHNHLGTTVATTDASGDLVQRTEYYPYGAVRFESEGFGEEYGFTGKERDEPTNTQYHTARYYLPALGRWLAADPADRVLSGESAEDGEAREAYAYSSSNPISYMDADGLAPTAGTSDSGYVLSEETNASEDDRSVPSDLSRVREKAETNPAFASVLGGRPACAETACILRAATLRRQISSARFHTVAADLITDREATEPIPLKDAARGDLLAFIRKSDATRGASGHIQTIETRYTVLFAPIPIVVTGQLSRYSRYAPSMGQFTFFRVLEGHMDNRFNSKLVPAATLNRGLLGWGHGLMQRLRPSSLEFHSARKWVGDPVRHRKAKP